VLLRKAFISHILSREDRYSDFPAFQAREKAPEFPVSVLLRAASGTGGARKERRSERRKRVCGKRGARSASAAPGEIAMQRGMVIEARTVASSSLRSWSQGLHMRVRKE